MDQGQDAVFDFPRPRCSYLNCSWIVLYETAVLIATYATQQHMRHSE